MATKKISAMTNGVTANAGDLIPIVRSGANKYITPDYLHPRAQLDNDVSPFNNITITTAVTTALTFDNIAFDTGGFYSAGQPTRFTVPVTALYLIHCHIQWSGSSGSGIRRLKITRNGAAEIGFADDGLTTHTNQVFQSLTIMRYLTAADYVRMEVLQTSGGNLDILQNDMSPVFAIARLGF